MYNFTGLEEKFCLLRSQQYYPVRIHVVRKYLPDIPGADIFRQEALVLAEATLNKVS